MKDKILAALKTKYKTFGFSDKAFDGVADYLSKTCVFKAYLGTVTGGVAELLRTGKSTVHMAGENFQIYADARIALLQTGKMMCN